MGRPTARCSQPMSLSSLSSINVLNLPHFCGSPVHKQETVQFTAPLEQMQLLERQLLLEHLQN